MIVTATHNACLLSASVAQAHTWHGLHVTAKRHTTHAIFFISVLLIYISSYLSAFTPTIDLQCLLMLAAASDRLISVLIYHARPNTPKPIAAKWSHAMPMMLQGKYTCIYCILTAVCAIGGAISQYPQRPFLRRFIREQRFTAYRCAFRRSLFLIKVIYIISSYFCYLIHRAVNFVSQRAGDSQVRCIFAGGGCEQRAYKTFD